MSDRRGSHHQQTEGHKATISFVFSDSATLSRTTFPIYTLVASLSSCTERPSAERKPEVKHKTKEHTLQEHPWLPVAALATTMTARQRIVPHSGSSTSTWTRQRCAGRESSGAVSRSQLSHQTSWKHSTESPPNTPSQKKASDTMLCVMAM